MDQRVPASSPGEPAQLRDGASVDADDAEAGDDYGRYIEEVLEIVEQIPPGQVTSYGRIAAAVGWGGPRQVGQVMATFGSEVAWWRVVRANGALSAAKQQRARPHYLREGTPLRGNGAVDMRQALWEPEVELTGEDGAER